MARFFRDLSAREKLRVTGADRIRFLNGQTTNDVRRATANETQESCVLNAKGHLEAHLFLFATTDAIMLDAAPELRESLAPRVERYIIADDVTLEEVSEQFALFHVMSYERPASSSASFALRSSRLGTPGWDFWVKNDEVAEFRTQLSDLTEMTEEDWEVRRVENGVPRWGRELTPEILPPEANLSDVAIDYGKGCYIGQETISRLKMSGQLRQRLCGVRPPEGVALSEGATLRAADKVVGRVTSAVFSERLGSSIGLALIKRGFNNHGTDLLTADDIPVTVTELPFRSAP